MSNYILRHNLAEADVDVSARRARVIVISEGKGNSRDSNYYIPDAVVSLAQALNGKQAYIDHPSSIDEESRPERSIRDLAGWFENAKVGTVKHPTTGDALTACFADLVFAESEPGNLAMGQCVAAVAYGKRFPNSPDVFVGLSINAGGLSEPGTIDGDSVNIVHEIESIFSADIVTKPARGGKIISMLAESVASGHVLGTRPYSFFTAKELRAMGYREAAMVGDAKFPEPTDAWSHKTAEDEVAPPGREPQVKALKKKPGISNPFAVAWSSYDKGEAQSASAHGPVLRFSKSKLAAVAKAIRAHLAKRMARTSGAPDVTDLDPGTPVAAYRADKIRKAAIAKSMGKPPASEAVRTFTEAYGGAGMAGTEMHDRDPILPYPAEDGSKLDKASPEVNYRYSEDPDRMCGTCEHFDATDDEEFGGGCELVAGVVRGVDVCDLWEAMKKNPAAQEALRAFRSRWEQ